MLLTGLFRVCRLVGRWRVFAVRRRTGALSVVHLPTSGHSGDRRRVSGSRFAQSRPADLCHRRGIDGAGRRQYFRQACLVATFAAGGGARMQSRPGIRFSTFPVGGHRQADAHRYRRVRQDRLDDVRAEYSGLDLDCFSGFGRLGAMAISG